MLSGVLTCHFVISAPKHHQINFRLTNDEFLGKQASKFQCTIPDWCKFSQLKILGCLSDTWHLASARGCQAWHAGMLPQQLNMSSSTCGQGGQHSRPDPVSSLGSTQAKHAWERQADTVNIKPQQAWIVICSPLSVEKSHYSTLSIFIVQVWPGYTAPTISQDTSGLLYFIPNPARRMFAAAYMSQRQKISVLPLAGEEKTWAGALTEPRGRGVFLSGQFSQFSQILDTSNVPDIWIQFLQRKNLRHFNPFGGLKSRGKWKHPLHS